MKRSMWILLFLLTAGVDECGAPPVSSSGIAKATVAVPTGPDGLTAEQRNIRDRLVEDNKPGVVKHLYLVSAYSGQVIVYSTVRGKVTSGGKRLTPTMTIGDTGNTNSYFAVDIGGQTVGTAEVLQDDGSYGNSMDYLYWWDEQGRYNQVYPTGGVIVVVSSEPIRASSVTINMDIRNAPPTKTP